MFFPYFFSYKLLALCIVIYAVLFFLLRKKSGWLLLLFVCFLLDFGYCMMGLRVHRLKDNKLMFNTGKVEIVGKIEKLLPYEKHGKVEERIVIEVKSIQKLKKPFIKVEVRNKVLPFFNEKGLMQNTPKNVRVNLKNNYKFAKVGDVIKIKAGLMPLPKKAYPTGYDFEKYAYFEQIGAIGYGGEILEIIKKADLGFLDRTGNNISNLRNSLAKNISTNIDKSSIGIVVSLLTGIKAYIKKPDLNNLRTSGLAHLIAVSGLHMLIVAGFIMFITRWIFSRVEYFALNFNVKKWSAVLGLVGSFAYLSMVGFPISAQRAYIMISIVLLAVIFDKEAYSLRSVAFAGLFLLIFRPELIASVGFQMSFMAVIGLISMFRLLREKGVKLYTTNKFLKPFYYIIGSLIASIIATICVMPFSIYYFNVFSTYNILANIIAVPLMVFWVVPMVLFSFVLLPFGLEKLLLIPASWGTDFIVLISEKIVSMPNAVRIVASPTKLSMGLIIGGALWFLLWNKKWRWFGTPVILAGLVLAFIKPTPDLIVDYRDKVFAITDSKGKLYFSKEPNSYKKDIWMKKMGEETFRLIETYPHKDLGVLKHRVNKKGISVSKDVLIEKTQGQNGLDKSLKCNKDYCLIKNGVELIYIVKTRGGIKIACTYGDEVINLSTKKIWYCKDMNNVHQKKWGAEEVEVLKF